MKCLLFYVQELENLRKQAEIIPQLMAECESIGTKLQVCYLLLYLFKSFQHIFNKQTKSQFSTTLIHGYNSSCSSASQNKIPSYRILKVTSLGDKGKKEKPLYCG